MKQSFSHSGVQFVLPRGYSWIVNKGILDLDGRSPLEPWHLLPDDACRSLRQIWPGGPSVRDLITFAKRQDNDDYACFEIGEDGRVAGIAVIHGWTASGYDIDRRFPSIWDWLKDVVDEVRRWEELVDGPT